MTGAKTWPEGAESHSIARHHKIPEQIPFKQLMLTG